MFYGAHIYSQMAVTKILYQNPHHTLRVAQIDYQQNVGFLR